MPDWLKEWGTLVIALIGAGTGISSLIINGLNRRDTVRKEAKAKAAAEPWAELAGEPSDKGFAMAVGFHNPSGRHFVIRKAWLETPEGWHIVAYASPYFVDPEREPPPPEIVASGRTLDIEQSVGLPRPGAGSLACTLRFTIEPIGATSPPRDSNSAKPISVAMRFTGAWISANAEAIDLPAKITLRPRTTA